MLALVGGPAAALLAMWKLTTVPTALATVGMASAAPAATTVEQRRSRRRLRRRNPRPAAAASAPSVDGSGTALPSDVSGGSDWLKWPARIVKSVRSTLLS